MLLTTLPEDIILLVEKLLIFVLIESENQLIIVLDSKDSQFSMLSEEVLDLVQDPFFWKDFLLIMERSPNQDLLFIHLHKFPLLLLSLTTLFFLLILYQNILMLLLCWIMKPFMISVEEIWILKDQPILILTDLLLRLSLP